MLSADHRILVVDDEKHITDLVAMAVRLKGATVEVAHSGRRIVGDRVGTCPTARRRRS